MSLAERPLLHVGLDPEALRRLLTRKPVILPASIGELVKLESRRDRLRMAGRVRHPVARFKARPFLGGETFLGGAVLSVTDAVLPPAVTTSAVGLCTWGKFTRVSCLVLVIPHFLMTASGE